MFAVNPTGSSQQSAAVLHSPVHDFDVAVRPNDTTLHSFLMHSRGA
jgi:hypothetical protein